MFIKVKLKELRSLVVRKVMCLAARPATISPASALIIAPHPDDETFGCGGLIALKCQMGVKVSVVFLTDGEASHKNCCETPPVMIGCARRELAHEICADLGVSRDNVHWLGLTDGSIPNVGEPGFTEAVQQLAELMDLLTPEEVFASHPQDSWPDHEAASELVLHALKQGRKCAVAELIYYPVWLWHNLRLRTLPTVVCYRIECIDISAVMHLKLKASWSYLENRNKTCGMPISGSLPEGFKAYIANENEFFMRARKQSQTNVVN